MNFPFGEYEQLKLDGHVLFVTLGGRLYLARRDPRFPTGPFEIVPVDTPDELTNQRTELNRQRLQAARRLQGFDAFAADVLAARGI